MKSFNIFILASLFFLPPSFGQMMKPYYYGVSSQEAQLTFTYFVEMEGPQASEKNIRISIDRQLIHLYGSFGANRVKASPKAQHQVQILKAEAITQGFRYHYQYVGKILIQNHSGTLYSFALPRDPYDIYARGVVYQGGNPTYPCTDSTHFQEQYFWYFWSPYFPGCPLKQGVDFDVVTGQIQTIENTDETYPDYDRLVDTNRRITISILMGMDKEDLSRNPYESTDIAAYNYRDLIQKLTQLDFQITPVNPKELKPYLSDTNPNDLTLHRATKKTRRGLIDILLYFGPTTMYSGIHFQELLKFSLETRSIFIYAGHSGLGETLDLDTIEWKQGIQFNLPQEKYQIYFFNGCSSYPYYNSEYFARKGGSQNLDILTNGLATYFSAIVPSTFEVIKAVDLWATTKRKTSYQSLVQAADSQNLLGINGDEDNPTSP